MFKVHIFMILRRNTEWFDLLVRSITLTAVVRKKDFLSEKLFGSQPFLPGIEIAWIL